MNSLDFSNLNSKIESIEQSIEQLLALSLKYPENSLDNPESYQAEFEALRDGIYERGGPNFDRGCQLAGWQKNEIDRDGLIACLKCSLQMSYTLRWLSDPTKV